MPCYFNMLPFPPHRHRARALLTRAARIWRTLTLPFSAYGGSYAPAGHGAPYHRISAPLVAEDAGRNWFVYPLNACMTVSAAYHVTRHAHGNRLRTVPYRLYAYTWRSWRETRGVRRRHWAGATEGGGQGQAGVKTSHRSPSWERQATEA